ncbi:hypothetical protein C9374_000357 [Naegleria lovaniensis]|uniref:Uncharacterized protein n=1 Tax=Naegleria lovaniensis TaxID=51637 RepID=A0AA88H0C1_NAELO|nr:uncharacterized protein C9374_000357 [Naegleria lovaniensis]KAG2388918.1 hypothetical protein C9374_000357 [Naegleria lovaniensis]
MYEMLLENNLHVLSIKVSSDIRKIGKLSARQLLNSQQKRNYGAFKQNNSKKMKELYEKEIKDDPRKKKTKKEEQNPTIQLIENVVNFMYSQEKYDTTDTFDKDEKQRKIMFLDHLEMMKNSLREAKAMVHAVTQTESIQQRWNTFMNAFIVFEYGQDVCEVLSKYIFQKTTYERWHVKTVHNAYPRFSETHGNICVADASLRFSSSENENGAEWILWYDDDDSNDHLLLDMESNCLSMKN